MTKRRLVAAAALAACTLVAACAPAGDEAGDDNAGCNGGKCDDADDDRLRDQSELVVDELVDRAVPLVFDEVNDFLSSAPFVDIKIDQPAFHHEDDIENLVTGLAARYGERELSTEVNRLRAKHLEGTEDTTYAEVSVEIDAEVAESWSFDTGGLEGLDDITSRVGFDIGTKVEGRIIGAYPFEPDDPLNNLRVLREAASPDNRGFVVPRDIEELRRMKPGELLALRGTGRLGVNFGAGVPLLVADPTSFLSYSLVLSTALRTYLEGIIDVQMVRVDDGELVLDVGIERARVRSARIALEDRWGVLGLLEAEVEIPGVDVTVDLGRLAEKALERQLNKRLDVISAYASRSSTKTRASVARFRIDLDEADPDLLEPMLKQALMGDIRLAQALANRGDAGFEAEFDFARSGLSTASAAGIDIFGLSFFKKRIESEGEVVIQTPGGARALMFDSLHEEGGWFVSRHGYTRVGLAGMVWDAEGKNPETEANLFVQVTENDKGMERDKYVDHIDALIIALAGPEAYEAIEGPANALEVFTQSLCPGAEISDSCTWDSTANPDHMDKRNAALAEFETAIRDLPDSTADFLLTAAEHKLLAQGTYEVKNNGFIGPGTDIFVDFRLDDATLTDLALNHTGEELATELTWILKATDVKRDIGEDEIKEERKDLVEDDDFAEDLAKVTKEFDAFAAKYRELLDAEEQEVGTYGALGPQAIEIRFEVDSNNRPLYKKAITRSLAKARADVAAEMFDALEDEADEWDPHEEQLVAYGLLSLALKDHLDIRFDIDHFLKDTFNGRRKVYRRADYPEHIRSYARGEKTDPIDGGLFDVDEMVFKD